MSRRLLLILFVIILFLFVLLLYLGSRTNRGGSFRLRLEAPSLQSIRRRLTARLESDEIVVSSGVQAGCAVRTTGLVVPPETRCVFTIRASSQKNRQATFTLGGEGVSVSLELEQPKLLTVEEILTQESDPLELDIFRNQDGVPASLVVRNCQTGDAPEGAPPARCLLRFER